MEEHHNHYNKDVNNTNKRDYGENGTDCPAAPALKTIMMETNKIVRSPNPKKNGKKDRKWHPKTQ